MLFADANALGGEKEKTAYNLWLGGIDAVAVRREEETERLRKKAEQETGENKKINAGQGKIQAAGNLQDLFDFSREGRGKTADVSEIISRNKGDEILAAKACRQCLRAALAGIALETYAQMHRELGIALAREK
ncbi:hypothetical protein KKH30_00895 [Candidatus Micrarchaeota archaeon]|nr:hypothetical protein [Candidatus Micrarchaeota archaeon]